MASFTVGRELAAPADRAWAVLTDWPSHGRWIAFTTVRTTSARPDGVGARFVGRTGIGRLGFDDPMVVTQWEPPAEGRRGRCTVRKDGRVMLGTASFVVRPLGPDRCALQWTEDLEVAGVRRLPLAAAATRLAGRVVFGAMLRKVARDVERPAAGAVG